MTQSWKIIIAVIITTALVGVGFFLLLQKEPKEKVYYGMLSVVTDCWEPEGCGPKYTLLNPEMKSPIPLLGDINDEHAELVIKVIGKETKLPESEYNAFPYYGSTTAIKVTSYQTLSKKPYFKLLLGKVVENAKGCQGLTSWDTTFSWEMEDEDNVFLKIRKSKLKGQPYNFHKHWYDGNTGEYIKSIVRPSEICKDSQNIIYECTSDTDCNDLEPDPEWGIKKCWFECPQGSAAGTPGSLENPGVCKACSPSV